jgi:hypothetical protein
MAVTINADNGAVSGSAGLKQSADSTGVLALQTNGTTAVSISTGQVVTLTQPLPVASGGTGATTLTANNVLLGNGTSAPQFVAPSTNGNVLTSNGTTWTSAALPAGGVTSLNGQTGAVVNTSLYAIGSYVTGKQRNSTLHAVDNTIAGSTLYAADTTWYPYNGSFYVPGVGNASGDVLVNVGTWRCVTPTLTTGGSYPMLTPSLWVRIS